MTLPTGLRLFAEQLRAHVIGDPNVCSSSTATNRQATRYSHHHHHHQLQHGNSHQSQAAASHATVAEAPDFVGNSSPQLPLPHVGVRRRAHRHSMYGCASRTSFNEHDDSLAAATAAESREVVTRSCIHQVSRHDKVSCFGAINCRKAGCYRDNLRYLQSSGQTLSGATSNENGVAANVVLKHRNSGGSSSSSSKSLKQAISCRTSTSEVRFQRETASIDAATLCNHLQSSNHEVEHLSAATPLAVQGASLSLWCWMGDEEALLASESHSSADLCASPTGRRLSQNILPLCLTLSTSSSANSQLGGPATARPPPPRSDSTFNDKVSLLQSCHAPSLLARMEDAWRAQQLCDVTLVVGGYRIPTHRLVLSAGSDYFAAMFNNDLVESHASEITIHDVDPKALECIVEYMYTGEVNIQEDSVEALLSAACLLQIPVVAAIACDFLLRQLHPSNCLGILHFAETHGCSRLQQQATVYALEHFTSLLEHQEFLLLDLQDVIALLDSDDLNVMSEASVFAAAVKWCKHDLRQRTAHFHRVLETVRLALLSPAFLTDVVEKQALLHDSLECHRQLLAAMRYHLLPERRVVHENRRTRPRSSTLGCVLALGGTTATHGVAELAELRPRQNCWNVTGQLAVQRLQCGAALLQGRLIVVGGRDGLKTLNTVHVLELKGMHITHQEDDPATAGIASLGTGTTVAFPPVTAISNGIVARWTALPSMSTHRHGLGVGVLNDVLYAVGGHDGWSYLNTVERWDMGSRFWSYVCPMSMPRSTVGVAILNGRLYAVGGRDGSSCLRSVEAFDPNSQKWSLCAPMICRRGGVGVAATGGRLYAVGGHDAPASNPSARCFDSVECYDPKSDQWTFVASLSSPRESVAVCVLGDCLLACGGCDGQNFSSDVEHYDPLTNKWKSMTSLPSGRAGLCALTVPWAALDRKMFPDATLDRSTSISVNTSPNYYDFQIEHHL